MPVTNERAHTNRLRAESFGRRAAQYDRIRPGYPDALFDDLVALGPGDVLDVGCGTGKAAVPLAVRGLRVLGVEIDERMAAVARSHGVAVEIAAFESWDDADRRFDLIVSGQAWHWVDPARGAHRAVELLRPGGQLALFWNVGDFAASLREPMYALYRAVAPSIIGPVGAGTPIGHTVDRYRAPLRASGLSRHHTATYDWQRIYSRDEWLDLLATHSDHATLPDDVYTRLLSRMAALIDERGGTITVEYATQVLLASR